MQHIIDQYYNLSSIYKALDYDKEWIKETKTTSDTTKPSTLLSTGDLTKFTSTTSATENSITSKPVYPNLFTDYRYTNIMTNGPIIVTTVHPLISATNDSSNTSFMTAESTTSTTQQVYSSKTTEITTTTTAAVPTCGPSLCCSGGCHRCVYSDSTYYCLWYGQTGYNFYTDASRCTTMGSSEIYCTYSTTCGIGPGGHGFGYGNGCG
ncbi:unnamed protein product [Adineta steineri]|uniref:Uncharacterized protein n=1 Tax=Adineta steineri TaxID=433720 RepID=A0A814G1K0_9BILA|nr:unnamed protein product [Adineta steineri]CAF0994646.1 unnamed protein product [Adineta steineri]